METRFSHHASRSMAEHTTWMIRIAAFAPAMRSLTHAIGQLAAILGSARDAGSSGLRNRFAHASDWAVLREQTEFQSESDLLRIDGRHGIQRLGGI